MTRLAVCAGLVSILLLPSRAIGEVTKVSITTRTTVAGGQPFGAVGAYEKLTGSIEFALDPSNPHSQAIVDLGYAERAADGKVHFTSEFVTSAGRPRLRLTSGFEPGRLYEVTYRAQNAVVAGVGLAAIRDAASAFLHREDLVVRGRSAYIFGASQSGRLLRQFLLDGFNVDERNRKVFDLAWPHIAGSGLGPFNERLALPGYSSFPATRFPYKYSVEQGPSGQSSGILQKYRADQVPKVVSTNTAVEYWGQGRMAAMTHTSLDGRETW